MYKGGGVKGGVSQAQDASYVCLEADRCLLAFSRLRFPRESGNTRYEGARNSRAPIGSAGEPLCCRKVVGLPSNSERGELARDYLLLCLTTLSSL